MVSVLNFFIFLFKISFYDYSIRVECLLPAKFYFIKFGTLFAV